MPTSIWHIVITIGQRWIAAVTLGLNGCAAVLKSVGGDISLRADPADCLHLKKVFEAILSTLSTNSGLNRAGLIGGSNS